MIDRHAALTLLEERFRSGLFRRVASLKSTLAETDPERIDRLRLQFHSLAGVGGTFGFPSLTYLGRAGEALCLAHSPNGAPPDGAPVFDEAIFVALIETIEGVARFVATSPALLEFLDAARRSTERAGPDVR